MCNLSTSNKLEIQQRIRKQQLLHSHRSSSKSAFQALLFHLAFSFSLQNISMITLLSFFSKQFPLPNPYLCHSPLQFGIVSNIAFFLSTSFQYLIFIILTKYSILFSGQGLIIPWRIVAVIFSLSACPAYGFIFTSFKPLKQHIHSQLKHIAAFQGLKFIQLQYCTHCKSRARKQRLQKHQRVCISTEKWM